MGTVDGINKAESKDAEGIGGDAALKLFFSKRKVNVNASLRGIWAGIQIRSLYHAVRAEATSLDHALGLQLQM